MRTALKIPGFFIKLADAVLLRIPVAFIAVFALLRVHGVKDSDIELIKSQYIIFKFVLPLAFAWGFIYVVCGRPYNSAAYGLGNVGKVLFALIIGWTVFQRASSGDGIVPYVMSLGLSAKLIIAWILYSLCSWFVKSIKAKKSKKSKGAADKKLGQIMTEFEAVSNAFLRMNIAQAEKKAEETIKKTPPAEESKPSGATSEKAFCDELIKKGYSIIRLKGNMTIVFAGRSGFVLKFIREKAYYTLKDGMWHKDGEPCGDVNAEVNEVINLLRSKCSMSWTRGLIVKTFAGGKVPTTYHLRYADVSKNYNAAEEQIIKHVYPDPIGKKSTAQTADRIKRVFADKIVKAGGEK